MEQKKDADFVAEQLSAKHLCAAALGDLSRLPNYKAFSEPVDPVAHKCPDYASVIQEPMDLGTVRTKLNVGKYATVEDFAIDVRLTFSNSMKYNPPMHTLHSAARTFSNYFERSMKKLFKLTKARFNLNGVTSSANLMSSLKEISLTESIEEVELASTRENKDGGKGMLSSIELGPPPRLSRSCSVTSNFCSSSSLASKDQSSIFSSSSSTCYHFRRPSNTGFHALPHSSSFCGEVGGVLRKGKIDADDGSVLSDCDEYQLSLSRKPSCSSLVAFEGGKQAASPQQRVVGVGGDSCSPPTTDPASSGETASISSIAVGGNGCDPRAGISTSDSSSTRLGRGEGTVQQAVRGNKMKWLLSELCKSVGRMKRDLFVVELAAPDADLADTAWESAVEVSSAVDNVGHGGDSKRCGLVPDVDIDPDPKCTSALADSRHTLLEMCQFRHYQFDTLRRAKHSSAMVLYHLHRPQAHSLNPFCSHCGKAIRTIRFHCSKCSFDSCQECQEVLMCRCQEEHNLVPYQVTFVVNMVSEDAAQQQKSSLPLDTTDREKEG